MNALRNMRGDDRGSAMVAALATALIGISLATVVVTQAIVAIRDSARDTVRTQEVHAAEAAVDATLLALESGFPCPAPGFSPAVIGEGADAVSVTVEITYLDDVGDVIPSSSCDSGTGVLSVVPYGALIRSTATPETPALGVAPKRVIETRVNIEPHQSESHGAAIFSASGFSTGAGFSLLPAVAGEEGDVWIDSGDFRCNTGVYIEGNLYVVDGFVSFQNNSCRVEGDVWAETYFAVHDSQSGTPAVGGDVTTVQGDIIPYQSNIVIGGNAYIGGTESGPGSILTTGTYQEGLAGTINSKTATGLPYIDYIPSEWTAAGFTNFRDRSDWANDIIGMAQANGDMDKPWQVSSFQSNPCYLAQHLTGKDPLVFPASLGDVVYDLRTCELETGQAVEFELNGDVALFVESYRTTNGIKFRSADGQKHTVYLIVPQGDVASTPGGYSSGDIRFANNTVLEPPVEIFLYTPNTLVWYNNTTTYGQMYAGTVEVNPHADFYYAPSALEAWDFELEPSATGADVEILYKREVN